MLRELSPEAIALNEYHLNVIPIKYSFFQLNSNFDDKVG